VLFLQFVAATPISKVNCDKMELLRCRASHEFCSYYLSTIAPNLYKKFWATAHETRESL